MATVQKPAAGDLTSILGPKRPARGKVRGRRTATVPRTDDRVARLLSASPAVIYSFKATGDFAPTFVSENIKDWLGYEPQRIPGEPRVLAALCASRRSRRGGGRVRPAVQKGRHTVEYRFLKKDGTYCWVNDEQRLIRDGNGEPAEVVGSWSDISERKRAEDAAGGAGPHRAPARQLACRDLQLQGDRRLRARPSSARTSRICSATTARSTSRARTSGAAACTRTTCRASCGDYERLFEEGRLSNEYRFRKKDGSYCWVSDELQLLRDAAGEPVEVVGAWNDITARKQIGEALVAAQDRIVRLLSSAPAVIYSYKATGDFAPTFVSAEHQGLARLRAARVSRRARISGGAGCIPRTSPRWRPSPSSCSRKGQHTVEYRFLKKDGTYCWVNDEQRLVRDEDGQPVEVVGSWSDISERKAAEEAAAAAAARIEHLLASSPAVIYSFRAIGDYAPTFISQNIKDLLGYDREEYLESPDFWVSRVHPQDSPRILRAYERLFEEGRLSSEYRFRKKDGSYCWVSDELQVLRDAAGEPVEVVGAWSDITARKQLGEALVAAQDRLVHLLSCAPAVIYSFKATGDFAPTFVSQNISDWLGYEPQEYLENPEFWWRCVHPDDLAGGGGRVGQLFKKGRHTVEYRFLKKDGTYCWVDRRAAPDPRPGR